jgi:Dyp-type peroxidase family
MSVREAPAPDPLHCGVDGPSHPAAEDEPKLNVDNIQGNILAGFNKDTQTLVFLRIDSVINFKPWLRSFTPRIATLGEVITFNRLFKSMRRRLDADPSLKVTSINVGFTFPGLQLLRNDANLFSDRAFRDGLRARSPQLGDPISATDEGHPNNWLVVDGAVGGAALNTVAHVVFIVAGDDKNDVDNVVNEIKAAAGANGATPVGFAGTANQGHEDGENLPGSLGGHEHFGFLDGVSQPGVRGRLSDEPHDLLTVRQNPNNRDQGKPGQELIWPGEFVVGYPSGPPNPDGEGDPFTEPGPISTAGPPWANDGSFLVFRRLRQKVSQFHTFLRHQRDVLQGMGAPAAVTADLVGARLVGRWRSGAPVLRTRNPNAALNDQDNPTLADNDCANNNFEFQESTAALPQTAFDDPFDCTDNNPNPPPPLFQAAREDQEGLVCPFTGHVRKVYPRDDVTLNRDFPVPELDGNAITTIDGEDEIALNEDDTQTHRILRRGSPFGPPLRHNDGQFSTPDNPAMDDGVDRGLHFLAYQTSIEDQFEFITRNWVNNPDFKEPSDATVNPPDPNNPREPNQRGGHDPIIGQNNKAGENRIREFTIAYTDNAGNRTARRVNTDDGTGNGLDWVIPTGGGYFFSPSIRALQDELTS